MWWAAESCEGDADFLEEKYLSLLKHVSNVHRWEDGYKMTVCEHADLPQDDQTLWLVIDSNEYNVLEKIMTDFFTLPNVCFSFSKHEHADTTSCYWK